MASSSFSFPRPRASTNSLRTSTISAASVTATPKSSLRSSRSLHKNKDRLPIPEETPTRLDNGLLTLRYEEAAPARPPIPVTVPPPRQPPVEEHPAFRRDFSALREGDEGKRDSGLAPTTASSRKGGRSERSFGIGEGSIMTVEEGHGVGASPEEVLGVRIDFDTPASPPKSSSSSAAKPSTERAQPIEKVESAGSGNRLRKKRSLKQAPPKEELQEFQPIETDIPTESLLSEDFMNKMTFSNRGSVMLGGKKVRPSSAKENGQARMNGGRRQPSFSMLAQPTKSLLSADVEMESQKVMSMYAQGASLDWEGTGFGGDSTPNGNLSPKVKNVLQRPETAVSERKEHELAGGIEDWEDVNGLDVDRYGFISQQQRDSGRGTPEPRPPQRVSTVLQLASEAPRKTRGFGRAPSTAASSPFKRDPSRKVSSRSLRTNGSNSSQRSDSRIRAVANRLPGNKDRRWMDEAGDMLTLPPGLADIAEDEEGGRMVETMKKREWDRTEKWRKMAKVVKSGKDGEGMEFEFDTKNPKVIERTWKGIPDRWRAAAWYSFLSTSAKKHKDSATEQQIIVAFHKHLAEASADDVQIDLDVPRTINSHIMFRRRYRGGQRLLFRVLHALSLYFPQTGYVQGMASLAATLLCYFDEEKAFVMLVRMWTLRGLSKLYESGFLGLMAALDEFSSSWLSSREVASKLQELNIEPTAYGTRWYLTLFNYSIPFPAQLRVWDVFLLLGDADPAIPMTVERPFAGGLDVLHATAAALIDATREILLDSDFENAMKVLTSWVPVKDEELLMRVARAEWRGGGGRKRK